MFAIGTPLSIVAGLGGLLALFGVGTFLFQAGCAMADVPERGYFHSLPIYSASVVLCVPLAVALIWFAGSYDADPNNPLGTLRIVAALVALLLTWILSATIYTLILSASLRKGLMIAGVELLLMALLAALLAAFVFVVLAFVQIGTQTPMNRLSVGVVPRSTLRI